MKVLLKIASLFFTCLVFLQSCSQSDEEQPPKDPFRGLKVLETNVLLDITDQDSANAGKFFFQSKYFRAMVIGREGHYFVTNVRGSGILHFNNEGQFVAQIGKNGKGPGEFQNTPDIDIAHTDTLFALNDRAWVVDMFVNSGGAWTHSSSFKLEQHDEIEPEGIIQVNEKQLAIEYAPNFRRYLYENDDSTYHKIIDVLSTTGTFLQDSLLIVPNSQYFGYSAKSGGGVVQDVPLGYRSIIEAGPDNQFYHLMTDEFRINIYGSEGQITDTIRHASYSMKLSEDERRSAIEEEVSVSMGSESEDRAMKEQLFEEMPDSLLPLNDMHVDRDTGYIIVRRSELYDGPNWLLLDPEGNRLGKFHLDESLHVFDFRNGRIIGALMGEDEDMLPTIRVVSLPPTAM